MKKKVQVGEPKSKSRLQTNPIIETQIETPSLEVGNKKEDVAMSITKQQARFMNQDRIIRQ